MKLVRGESGTNACMALRVVITSSALGLCWARVGGLSGSVRKKAGAGPGARGRTWGGTIRHRTRRWCHCWLSATWKGGAWTEWRWWWRRRVCGAMSRTHGGTPLRLTWAQRGTCLVRRGCPGAPRVAAPCGSSLPSCWDGGQRRCGQTTRSVLRRKQARIMTRSWMDQRGRRRRRRRKRSGGKRRACREQGVKRRWSWRGRSWKSGV